MNKSAQLIARIKEVQLRGNTAPENVGLLDEIVEHLRELDMQIENLEAAHVPRGSISASEFFEGKADD